MSASDLAPIIHTPHFETTRLSGTPGNGSYEVVIPHDDTSHRHHGGTFVLGVGGCMDMTAEYLKPVVVELSGMGVMAGRLKERVARDAWHVGSLVSTAKVEAQHALNVHSAVRSIIDYCAPDVLVLYGHSLGGPKASQGILQLLANGTADPVPDTLAVVEVHAPGRDGPYEGDFSAGNIAATLGRELADVSAEKVSFGRVALGKVKHAINPLTAASNAADVRYAAHVDNRETIHELEGHGVYVCHVYGDHDNVVKMPGVLGEETVVMHAGHFGPFTHRHQYTTILASNTLTRIDAH